MASGNVLLEELWADVINGNLDKKSLRSTVAYAKQRPTAPFADAGAAMARMLKAGVSVDDICRFARYERYDACFQVLYKICALGVESADLDGLYELLLSADPSGEEGRPSSWPVPKKGAARKKQKTASDKKGERPLLELKKSYDVAFSPDGKQLAILATVPEVVDLATQKSVKLDMPSHTGHLAFSPKGDRVAGLSTSGRIGVCDAKTGKSLIKLDDCKTEGNRVQFSPNGSKLVSGDWDGNLWIWDLRKGKLDRKVEVAPDAMIEDLEFTADGKTLIVAVYVRGDEQSNFLSLWNWPLGERQRSRINAEKMGKARMEVCRIAVCQKTDELAVLKKNESVAIIKLPSGRVLREYAVEDAAELSWSPDGHWLAIKPHAGKIILLNASNMTEAGQVEIPYPERPKFSPDSRLLAIGSWSKGQIWEVDHLVERSG